MENQRPAMPDHEGDAWHDKEQARTEGYRMSLDESRRFKPPGATELEEEAKKQSAPRKKYEHEDHARFREFYRALSYDERTEFALKPPEEKEAIFLAWLDEQQQKTA